MESGIAVVIGRLAAAELVDAYRRRLEHLDLLPTAAAHSLACEAHARCCVYLVAAPGQIWQAQTAVARPVLRLELLAVTADHHVGHLALARSADDTLVAISLDRLGESYRLVGWPGREAPPATG